MLNKIFEENPKSIEITWIVTKEDANEYFRNLNSMRFFTPNMYTGFLDLFYEEEIND